MNLNEVFKKIEMALTPSEEVQKVEMANMQLANGVTIEAESFEAGQNVFLVGEDEEKVAAPVGEHELEDGRILVIEEEGVIAEIKEAVEAPAEEEVEVEQAAEEEEEMSAEEAKVEMSIDEAPAAKKVAAAPVEKKVEMNRYAKKAPQNTLSRVLSKLS